MLVLVWVVWLSLIRPPYFFWSQQRNKHCIGFGKFWTAIGHVMHHSNLSLLSFWRLRMVTLWVKLAPKSGILTWNDSWIPMMVITLGPLLQRILRLSSLAPLFLLWPWKAQHPRLALPSMTKKSVLLSSGWCWGTFTPTTCYNTLLQSVTWTFGLHVWNLLFGVYVFESWR